MGICSGGLKNDQHDKFDEVVIFYNHSEVAAYWGFQNLGLTGLSNSPPLRLVSFQASLSVWFAHTRPY